ncbi:MAG: hypothetical protein KF893_11205 [Caldilineaceae bacterium]|nr:hypothetical protein [Caldilineaceae bacterium]
MTVSYKLLLYRLVTALFTTLSVLAAGLFLVNDTATANNPVIVRVVDADCKDPGKTWAYNSVDEAVMDTIPLEWWPPSLIGGTVTFDSLKAAAVIVRSRILFHVRVLLNSAYNYSTANYDSRKPGELWNPACATGDAFTMNTVENAKNYSTTSYDSNNATAQTSGVYIVNNGNLAEMVGFYPPIQEESTICTVQSGDWKFCAVSALGRDIDRSNNRYVRRLNITRSNWIEFEAETYFQRIARSSHFWTCYVGMGESGNCAQRADPNNGDSIGSNVNYPTLSPEMQYRVAFPISDGTTNWYIWILGRGCGVNNDSLHVGMNGQKLTGSVLGFGENMTGWSECGFAWRSETEGGGRPYLRPNFYDTNSAFQTVNIWMKEDGLYVDRIILTTDPSDKIFKQFIPFVLK